jgi:hypothetical protein
VELPSVSRPAFGGGQVGNRRRVVEVEVLRHPAKPAVPEPAPRPEPVAVASPPVAAPRPALDEQRPLRRIVVAPPRDEPAATPEAARDRVRTVIRGLSKPDQRRVVLDLLDELGGPEKPPEPEEPPESEEPLPPPVDRERVLAAVADALGLGSADLARALYDDETPGSRTKARSALERWRKG